MAWLQLNIELSGRDPGRIEAALEEAGALAITLSDAGDQPLLEPGVGETPLWAATVLTALFEGGIDTAAVETRLSSCDIESGTWDRLEDRVWEREWLSRFSAQQFGPALWIVPGDLNPPDTDAINVRLDPGLAFGTGDHPTTALCLEWLGQHDVSGQRVLDYGCGSGILAVAALKSGAQGATAVDIDPQALLATRDNARRNGVSDALKALPPEKLADTDFDLLFANILAAPLIELAARLTATLRPGGHLVLSGILPKQVQEVMAAYAADIVWTGCRYRQDWSRLCGIRKEAR